MNLDPKERNAPCSYTEDEIHILCLVQMSACDPVGETQFMKRNRYQGQVI